LRLCVLAVKVFIAPAPQKKIQPLKPAKAITTKLFTFIPEIKVKQL
jgi:hypothetical protein